MKYLCHLLSLLQLHTIVREIPMIQITYGATSTSLSDRTEYPFLLRPHPTDSKQTDYMVQLLLALREKGNTINAVNIVYSNSLYGRGSYEVSRTLFSRCSFFDYDALLNDTTEQQRHNLLTLHLVVVTGLRYQNCLQSK